MAITNKIGAPVTGDDFFGRVKELLQAHRYLSEKQSLLLSAPRRIGKTSFAKKLISDKTSQKWRCIYIDLQGIATEEAFLRKLIESFTGGGIMEKAGKKVKDLIESTFNITEGIELGALRIDLSRRDNLETLYLRLSETFDYKDDTLVVIDELPLFLGKLMGRDEQNREEVEFLLNWFRSIRQYENSKIRWIFCGSVGLRNFTNHHRMSQAINDLIDFKLGELSKEEATGLIVALADSYGLTIDKNVTTTTLELMQWPIPYFIQLLMDRLILKKQNFWETPVLIEDIECALDELSQSDYFMTWDERLDEYRELEYMARTVLDNVALAEAGLTKEQLLQIVMRSTPITEEPSVRKDLAKVMEMLEHDGYIIRSEGRRKFRSPLLRKWWKYKFID